MALSRAWTEPPAHRPHDRIAKRSLLTPKLVGGLTSEPASCERLVQSAATLVV